MKQTLAKMIKQMEKANADYALHNDDIPLFSEMVMRQCREFKKILRVAKLGNRLYAERFGRNAISASVRWEMGI